jgi:hypothetical protein
MFSCTWSTVPIEPYLPPLFNYNCIWLKFSNWALVGSTVPILSCILLHCSYIAVYLAPLLLYWTVSGSTVPSWAVLDPLFILSRICFHYSNITVSGSSSPIELYLALLFLLSCILLHCSYIELYLAPLLLYWAVFDPLFLLSRICLHIQIYLYPAPRIRNGIQKYFRVFIRDLGVVDLWKKTEVENLSRLFL